MLAEYPAPFHDLGAPTKAETWHGGEVVEKTDSNDDAVYEKILAALNERQMRCDVPLNLTSTSLVTPLPAARVRSAGVTASRCQTYPQPDSRPAPARASVARAGRPRRSQLWILPEEAP